ncbi:U3 small nucleolar RNA-associated protein 22 [Cyphellophora attinorum]|uniref:U3 small nucleolar RNA-associated protein 22 n=1 Tax=Cyphellophora attinorum TaxID=1664694 RepID=A0A0N1NWZ3_9EURO|nr:U3 small nucleolar RNA-associated protein 22 [Phialophora attinorum]KPI34383.1 U3 small nucleolar RNA-associated protein 22 [Phialophora attinorum]
MSRKEMTEASAKRRKLSHDSADGIHHSRRAVPHHASESNGGSDNRAKGSVESTPPVRQVKFGHSSAVDQVRSILAEVTPRNGSRYRSAVECAEFIASAVREVPSEGPYTGEEATNHLQNMGSTAIPFPIPKPGKDSKLKFEYIAPSKVTLHSEIIQSLGIQAENALTIVAQMPMDLLQDKDYLNLRAFQKRAFFLACIAAGLRRTKFADDFDFQYSNQHGVKLLPVLQLTPRDMSQYKGAIFRVDVSLPSDSWPLSKTAPSMNCVRTIEGATPFYNSCLRYTASVMALDQLIDSASKQAPSFADSCRLGQYWLQKRGFSSSVADGGFGWEEWTIVCALLLRTGGPRGSPLFSSRYSALQLFKAILQTLSSRDMLDPWILRGTTSIEGSPVPVLYDAENGLNLLYKMTGASYQALQASARSSLAVLGSKSLSSFDDIFNDELGQHLLQYDEIYSIKGFTIALEDAAAQMAPYHRLVEILQRGLGDRVRSVDIRPRSNPLWPISAQPPNKKRAVTVSIVLDPKNADRLVDHGPAAEEQEAAEAFRQFWGDKAELRRFRDGSITESLVWDSSTPVTKQILCQLLKVHFSLDSEHVQQVTVDISGALPTSSSDATAHFTLVDQTFQKLSATLLGLAGLPLPIRSVSPASEHLRSSSLSVAVTEPVLGPVDVLIEFDSSGRWPDSLPAIQHTKIAFLVKLGDVLTAADTSLSTRIGLENVEHDVSGHHNTSFLDVTCGPTQKACHQLLLEYVSTTPAQTRDSLAVAVANYKRHFVAASRHSTALRVLMTQHPALSATIRLLKSWISSHLLTQHVPGECLEIIACSVFLQPSPRSAPAQATTAFLRCLALLAQWDWSTTPMIIDLSPGGDMTDAARTELSTRFQAWRKLDPMMNQVSWFIGSSVDETGTVWTSKTRMEKVIAARVQSLAAACLQVVYESTEQWTMDTATSLFVPPLQDYDFLITLRKQSLPRRHDVASDEKFRNLSVEMESSSGDSGSNPVQSFLDEINGVLGGTALFLYGDSRQGGKVIAGLWRPNTHGTKEWRVRLGWSSRPHTADDENGNETCALNKEGVLKEIEILGRDLVKDVKYLR